MCTGRLLLLLLGGLAVAPASEIACAEPASCTGQLDCTRNYYSVSKVCFTRTQCKQFSICPARNETFDLHLSLRFSTVLLSTHCHLWLSNATGRQQYDLSAEGPGATGLYLRTTLAGGNVTIQYMCDGSAPEAQSGSLRLDVEYYFDPHSRPLCSITNTSYRCDTSGCVPLSWRCNGLAECSDGYDEFNCAAPPAAKDQRTTELLPSHGSAPCSAGGCSPIRTPDCTASDGDSPGCRSGSTESPVSSSTACTSGNATFRCSESGICIPATWRCDQSLDCSDGSDENDCEGASVRVITAAVIGSLVCSILVVIAAGCTCKLYTLRMMQEQRHHRRSRRYEMPMTAFQSEMMRRRAPPPSYDAAMRPLSEATAVPAPAELVAAASQQQPQLDEMQRELLAHIEAVATAVRSQHARHHHHHRHHHYQRTRLAAESSDPGIGGGAVAITMPQEMMPSPLAPATTVERRPCQQQPQPLAPLACISCGSGIDPPPAAEPPSLHADVTGRTRAGGYTDSAVGGSMLPPAGVDGGSTAAQQHASASLVSLTACSHADGDECERVRAAAVREQLDQFLPTLPSFRCVGHRSASSATVDNVRITASLTASYERTCHGGGAAAAGTSGSRSSAWTRGGGGPQQQRATYNVAFVASESDDEPLLFAGRGDSSGESSGTSSAASTPAADAHAPLLGFGANAYGCDDGTPAAAGAAAALVATAATGSIEAPLTNGAPGEPAAVGPLGGAATSNSAGACMRAAGAATQQRPDKL